MYCFQSIQDFSRRLSLCGEQIYFCSNERSSIYLELADNQVFGQLRIISSLTRLGTYPRGFVLMKTTI